MKKLIVLAAVLTTVVATAAPVPKEVNEKVLKAFKETFIAAEDVSWQEFDDYYQANFRQDDIQVRVQYDDNGKLLRTTRYYTEKQLMPNILSKLKSKYAGAVITGITETTSSDEITFVINLKDEENWYIVKSDVYGNLQLNQKFKRADKS
jgi:hypothetical protein